jgi:hypothetical protein
MTVPARDLQAAYRLLDDMVVLASPEFGSDLAELRSLLEQFESRTLSEAWGRIAAP